MTKEPKIVQYSVDREGVLNLILYEDGRLFQFRTDELDQSGPVPVKVGHWQEIKYPIPRIPIPPDTARRSARSKHKQK